MDNDGLSCAHVLELTQIPRKRGGYLLKLTRFYTHCAKMLPAIIQALPLFTVYPSE